MYSIERERETKEKQPSRSALFFGRGRRTCRSGLVPLEESSDCDCHPRLSARFALRLMSRPFLTSVIDYSKEKANLLWCPLEESTAGGPSLTANMKSGAPRRGWRTSFDLIWLRVAYACGFGLCKGGCWGALSSTSFLRVVHARGNPPIFNACAISPRNPSTINTCTSVSFQTAYNPCSSHTCKPRFSQLLRLQHMRKKERRTARRHFRVRRLAAAFTAETMTPHGSFASNGFRRKSGSKLPHSKGKNPKMATWKVAATTARSDPREKPQGSKARPALQVEHHDLRQEVAHPPENGGRTRRALTALAR